MIRFKTALPWFLSAALMLCEVQAVHAASLVVSWDPSADTTVAGYVVSYGTASKTYSSSVRTQGSTAVTLSGLAEATVYYVVVQSYDQKGAVGPPSAEVSGQTGLSKPSISCPSPVVTSTDGNPVAVSLLAVSSGGVLPVSIACSPASGSLFKVGTTPFSCTATDAAKQTASCSSTVVVLAPATTTLPPTTAPTSTPLTIACPVIEPLTANGNSGRTVVRFPDPVVSGGTLPYAVSCTPKSGTQFSVGTTLISCQAIDASKQVASCSMPATVLSDR